MPPPNDSSIADEADLFRRVPSTQIVRDRNRGCLRPSSGHFSHYEMSVVIGDKLQEDGREPRQALGSRGEDFLVTLTAEFVRAEEQGVVHTPTAEERAHGDVVGKKPKPRQRRFARTARWEIPPPDDFQLSSG